MSHGNISGVQIVRGGRGIKDNKCGYLPRYIIAVDTETTPTLQESRAVCYSHTFRLGVAICCRLRDGRPSGERTVRLNTPDDFYNLLCELTGPRHTVWIVAHNALFDFITLRLPDLVEQGKISLHWPRAKRAESVQLDCGRQNLGLAVIESPPTVIALQIGTTQGRCVFVDTLNWFPQPLSELGATLGINKLSMPDFAASDEHWFSYCEQDARIVYNAFLSLIHFVDGNDLGQFRYTAASQAYNAWRHKYYTQKVYPHGDEAIKRLERASYFAGRSEAFKRGHIDEKVYQLDVRSMFPSVMRSQSFPYTLERHEHRADYLELRPSLPLSECIAEVELFTRSPIYPSRANNKPVWATGNIYTVLAGPELFYAEQHGHIRRIRSWVHYRVAPLFREFVDGLSSLRCEYESRANSTMAGLCKLLLNSLYGKFAQRRATWANWPQEKVAEPWTSWGRPNRTTGKWDCFRSFGYIAQKKMDEVEKPDNFPAISSFVTAFARRLMDDYRAVAGERNCYYQGIDSLIVNEIGYFNLVQAGCVAERELGKLQLVGTADCGYINGIGDYAFGNKVIIGGLPRSSDFVGIDLYVQRKFVTKQRLFSKGAVSDVIETVTEWQRGPKTNRGTYDADGWLEPLELGGMNADKSTSN